MKHFKKFFSYLVALTMVLSLAAFTGVKVHAEDGYKLTIKNSDDSEFADGYSFAIYQILKGDVTPTNATDKNGNKTEKTLSNITWGDSVTPTAKADNDIGSDAKDFAGKLTDESAAETMAKKLANTADYLTAYNATGSRSTDKKSYTFSNLPGGYYLVKDTTNNVDKNDATSRYIVEVVGNTETVTKKSVPTTIKKVKENTKTVKVHTDDKIPNFNVGDQYNDVADYDIGDQVPFELIGTLPTDYAKYDSYYYQFTDDMDEHFELDSRSVNAYYTNENGDWTKIDSDYFNASTPDSDNKFTVTFGNGKEKSKGLKDITGIPASSKIKVEFEATLTANAKIGLPGNENKSYLTFSNDVNSNSHGKTAEDKVIVFTYEIDTTKIDAATKDQPNPTALKDAQFQIKKGDKYLHQNEKGYITWGSEEGAKTFTSDANGKFVIRGLDSGTYTFHETKAPDGYNLGDDVTATLTAETANNQSWAGEAKDALTTLKLGKTAQDATVQDTKDHGTASQEITNTKGSNLPSTGGMGTTLLYVAGGILVACAAAYVVMSRKHSTNK